MDWGDDVSCGEEEEEEDELWEGHDHVEPILTQAGVDMKSLKVHRRDTGQVHLQDL